MKSFVFAIAAVFAMSASVFACNCGQTQVVESTCCCQTQVVECKPTLRERRADARSERADARAEKAAARAEKVAARNCCEQVVVVKTVKTKVVAPCCN